MALGLFFTLSGCGGPKVAAKSEPPAAPVDPVEAKREQIRQGATSLTQAISDIHDASESATGLKSAAKEQALVAALTEITDSLDDAGGSIADYAADPPDLETFRQQADGFEKQRLLAINNANDALHLVNDAVDRLDDFLQSPPAAIKQQLDDLESSLEDAQDSLAEAIKALGGKVEEDPGTTDDTNAPNP